MAVISVRIPQIGEGLQEARLVAVLKQPGDNVKRDEPIYQMETDKAVMDVESPYEGVLLEWLGHPDDILAIGAEVARMEVEGEVQEMVVHGAAATEGAQPASLVGATGIRGANVPPRTRAYAREKGVTDEDLAKLAVSGAKLLPADIDAFIESRKSSAHPSAHPFSESTMSSKQRILASRLVRGQQLVVPGTMTVVANWNPIDNCRTRIKHSGDPFQPSAFTMFAFAVTQALKAFPIFRSTLIGEDVLRTFDHVQLGIAVSLPEDDLVLAVVPDADTLTWREFATKARDQIALARTGQDQANEAVTISLTNMQSYHLLNAIPVVVPPAVATLFLGSVHDTLAPDALDLKLQRSVNLTLTFDHRVCNGARAAQFLNAVKDKMETISSLVEL
ncbi:MAG: dihydrolipoamide acetyltransferase family protein [Fimbriimonas sp.]|nr:dihydrolipoamide acetyltransferase family protein [Fimbriimonas sp.]